MIKKRIKYEDFDGVEREETVDGQTYYIYRRQ